MIKRFLSVLICLLLSKNMFGQSFKNFQLGFTFSTDIINTLYSGNAGEAIQKVSATERPYWGYQFGSSLAFNFANWTDVEVGLHYARRGTEVHLPDNTTVFQGDYFVSRYSSIDLPIRFNIRIPISRLTLLAGAGCSASILLKYSGHGETGGKKFDFQYVDVIHQIFLNNPAIPKNQTNTWTYRIGTDEGANRKLNFIPFLALGIDYKINEKASFRLEPIFKYTLLNTSENKISSYTIDYSTTNHSVFYGQQHLWSFGVNTGLYFTL